MTIVVLFVVIMLTNDHTEHAEYQIRLILGWAKVNLFP